MAKLQNVDDPRRRDSGGDSDNRRLRRHCLTSFAIFEAFQHVIFSVKYVSICVPSTVHQITYGHSNKLMTSNSQDKQK